MGPELGDSRGGTLYPNGDPRKELMGGQGGRVRGLPGVTIFFSFGRVIKLGRDARKDAARCPQGAPRTPQDRVKIEKMVPRWFQDGPKSKNVVFSLVLGGFYAPRWFQDDFKMEPKAKKVGFPLF